MSFPTQSILFTLLGLWVVSVQSQSLTVRFLNNATDLETGIEFQYTPTMTLNMPIFVITAPGLLGNITQVVGYAPTGGTPVTGVTGVSGSLSTGLTFACDALTTGVTVYFYVTNVFTPKLTGQHPGNIVTRVFDSITSVNNFTNANINTVSNLDFGSFNSTLDSSSNAGDFVGIAMRTFSSQFDYVVDSIVLLPQTSFVAQTGELRVYQLFPAWDGGNPRLVPIDSRSFEVLDGSAPQSIVFNRRRIALPEFSVVGVYLPMGGLAINSCGFSMGAAPCQWGGHFQTSLSFTMPVDNPMVQSGDIGLIVRRAPAVTTNTVTLLAVGLQPPTSVGKYSILAASGVDFANLTVTGANALRMTIDVQTVFGTPVVALAPNVWRVFIAPVINGTYLLQYQYRVVVIPEKPTVAVNNLLVNTSHTIPTPMPIPGVLTTLHSMGSIVPAPGSLFPNAWSNNYWSYLSPVTQWLLYPSSHGGAFMFTSWTEKLTMYVSDNYVSLGAGFAVFVVVPVPRAPISPKPETAIAAITVRDSNGKVFGETDPLDVEAPVIAQVNFPDIGVNDYHLIIENDCDYTLIDGKHYILTFDINIVILDPSVPKALPLFVTSVPTVQLSTRVPLPRSQWGQFAVTTGTYAQIDTFRFVVSNTTGNTVQLAILTNLDPARLSPLAASAIQTLWLNTLSGADSVRKSSLEAALVGTGMEIDFSVPATTGSVANYLVSPVQPCYTGLWYILANIGDQSLCGSPPGSAAASSNNRKAVSDALVGIFIGTALLIVVLGFIYYKWIAKPTHGGSHHHIDDKSATLELSHETNAPVGVPATQFGGETPSNANTNTTGPSTPLA